MKKIIGVIMVSVILLGLAACSAGGQAGGGADLAGTNWTLTSLGGVAVEAGSGGTLQFGQDERASGNSGCNSYSGSYKTNGDKITVGPLASTMMACAEPGRMELEGRYLAALQSAASFKLEGTTLSLYGPDGTLLANFSRQ